jgi:hypothetical protein
MKWLKRKLRNWINEKDDEVSMKLTASRGVEAQMCESDPILNFRVFSAVGGKVVEFRRYDRQRDHNDTTTYIVTNDQDFGERISKIATMENLKS